MGREGTSQRHCHCATPAMKGAMEGIIRTYCIQDVLASRGTNLAAKHIYSPISRMTAAAIRAWNADVAGEILDGGDVAAWEKHLLDAKIRTPAKLAAFAAHCAAAPDAVGFLVARLSRLPLTDADEMSKFLAHMAS